MPSGLASKPETKTSAGSFRALICPPFPAKIRDSVRVYAGISRERVPLLGCGSPYESQLPANKPFVATQRQWRISPGIFQDYPDTLVEGYKKPARAESRPALAGDHRFDDGSQKTNSKPTFLELFCHAFLPLMSTPNVTARVMANYQTHR